jgi:small-conductance mechanosensitive channel
MLKLVATSAGVIAFICLVNAIIKRRSHMVSGEWQFGRHMTVIILSIIGLFIVFLAVPLNEETRDQLLGLTGVALTAMIALSSTTFVSNAMAGILLRSLNRFRPGDFIRIEDCMGRVTERGLFHTELQTEDRDLVTFPNFNLMSKPVRVVRASGTFISARVSLGYDTTHERIRSVLIEAADACGLEETFAQVLELGDYAITYRVAGFLRVVKQLITARSKLRMAVLDGLHGAGIEVVSPRFVVQRQLADDAKIIAGQASSDDVEKVAREDSDAEHVIFDKAESAEKIEELRAEKQVLSAEIAAMRESLKPTDESNQTQLDREIRLRETRLAWTAKSIERAEKSLAES